MLPCRADRSEHGLPDLSLGWTDRPRGAAQRCGHGALLVRLPLGRGPAPERARWARDRAHVAEQLPPGRCGYDLQEAPRGARRLRGARPGARRDEPGRAGAGEPSPRGDGDAQSERGTVDEDSQEAPRGRLVERAAQRLSAGGRSAGGAVGDDPRAPEGGARMSGRVLATERGYRVEVSYDARAVEGIKGIQIGRAHV